MGNNPLNTVHPLGLYWDVCPIGYYGGDCEGNNDGWGTGGWPTEASFAWWGVFVEQLPSLSDRRREHGGDSVGVDGKERERMGIVPRVN